MFTLSLRKRPWAPAAGVSHVLHQVVPARLAAYYNPPVHFVYIVRCADGTLYTGYACDADAREKVHNSGRGARYTSGRRPVRLVYCEACPSRSDALKREHAVKRLTRAQKEALIARHATSAAFGR